MPTGPQVPGPRIPGQQFYPYPGPWTVPTGPQVPAAPVPDNCIKLE